MFMAGCGGKVNIALQCINTEQESWRTKDRWLQVFHTWDRMGSNSIDPSFKWYAEGKTNIHQA